MPEEELRENKGVYMYMYIYYLKFVSPAYAFGRKVDVGYNIYVYILRLIEFSIFPEYQKNDFI